jgi:hypothetical protein
MFLRFLLLLAFLASVFFCSSDTASTAPYDQYDHENLLVVLNNERVDDNFCDVEFGLLREKMDQGDDPFYRGPIDWNGAILLSGFPTTADGKHYILKFRLRYEKSYRLSAGLSWKNKRYLMAEEMAGNQFFNNPTEDFSFVAHKDLDCVSYAYYDGD